ncbi:MAG TPA: DUF952 domain-containing protein [Anaerolineales bacterium]|nr:DUF952 domain-containing protein [Anaerolineales bacterium]
MIYHITSRRAWREAQQRGDYRAESLGSEGFIHCSTGTQVLPVAEKYYPGQRGLLVLVIDPALLTSDLKWEPPSGGTPPPGVPDGEPFPHVYGPINLDAIVKILDLDTSPDGKHTVPALD